MHNIFINIFVACHRGKMNYYLKIHENWVSESNCVYSRRNTDAVSSATKLQQCARGTRGIVSRCSVWLSIAVLSDMIPHSNAEGRGKWGRGVSERNSHK